MENSENGATADAPASPSPKRGFWRRLFLWGFLGGGVLFGVLGVFLIGIALPDLRREVAPPEISGTGQIARVDKNGKTPRSNDLPTSNTTITDLSGQVVLDLNDFPHLSPSTRQMEEVWVKAWNEKIQRIDVIAEPVLRGQLLEEMSGYAEAFKSLLNLPVKWGTDSYIESADKCYLQKKNIFFELLGKSIMYRPENGGASESYREAWKNCLSGSEYRTPVEGSSSEYINDYFYLVRTGFETLEKRMEFEVAVQHGEWVDAAHLNTSDDERVYCYRRMGFSGQIALAAGSLKRTLNVQPQDKGFPAFVGTMCDKVEDRTCSVWQNWIKPR